MHGDLGETLRDALALAAVDMRHLALTVTFSRNGGCIYRLQYCYMCKLNDGYIYYTSRSNGGYIYRSHDGYIYRLNDGYIYWLNDGYIYWLNDGYIYWLNDGYIRSM